MAGPARRKHVVNIIFLFGLLWVAPFSVQIVAPTSRLLVAATARSPILGHSTELVLKHLVVLVHQGTHVGFQTGGGIDRAH